MTLTDVILDVTVRPLVRASFAGTGCIHFAQRVSLTVRKFRGEFGKRSPRLAGTKARANLASMHFRRSAKANRSPPAGRGRGERWTEAPSRRGAWTGREMRNSADSCGFVCAGGGGGT